MNLPNVEDIDLTDWLLVAGDDLTNAFANCPSLRHIYVRKDTDWKRAGNVTGNLLFYNCVSLPNYDGATFDVSKANTGEGGYFEVKPVVGIWYHKVNGVWKQGQRYTKKNGI